MQASSIIVMDELVRTGCMISQELNYRELISILVEQSIDITSSDLACLYVYPDPEHKTGATGNPHLVYRRGRFHSPKTIQVKSQLVDFLLESKEAVVLTERKKSPFKEILLDPGMNSGVAFPLVTPQTDIGFLILNSLDPFHFNRSRFHFLDSLSKLTGGMLQNSRLFKELKESLEKIQSLERYQENIFSSMSNWLITTDREGNIQYFNRAARETMHLSDDVVGKNFVEIFHSNFDRTLIKAINKYSENPKTLPGIEGIYTFKEEERDFSLNISPLNDARKHIEGSTLLFTDQTKEKELQSEVTGIMEERRFIKDMFTRYLSEDLVHTIMEQPDLVKPGGSTKIATIFFADIRGYTAFSEGHSAEYVIEVLNEYFDSAVESVISHNGYIDKFIGDCIMAAWGVPVENPKKDAIEAVSCALEIQEMVASKNRKFFHGKAKDLRIGVGMHTGPLVAGNLGSSRKMNYTVIGDTVNLASRLEGVSKAGEIIITKDTRDFIGEEFLLEKREPVKVKGKKEPIEIYAVKNRAR